METLVGGVNRHEMRAHYLQHVCFEGLGSIASWLQKRGFGISCTQMFRAAELPELSTLDLLIVMGGPMSVNDVGRFPWLVAEKQFIRMAIQQGIPVLGVCLGAQLIASALGARVYRNSHKEIGWFPVHGLEPPVHPAFRFPSGMDVFQWHGETFDLPPGAVRLARSEACENQAFQIGSSAMALQFHLEMTPGSVSDLVDNCRDQLIPGPFVQSGEQILGVTEDKYASANALLEQVLNFLEIGKSFSNGRIGDR